MIEIMCFFLTNAYIEALLKLFFKKHEFKVKVHLLVYRIESSFPRCGSIV